MSDCQTDHHHQQQQYSIMMVYMGPFQCEKNITVFTSDRPTDQTTTKQPPKLSSVLNVRFNAILVIALIRILFYPTHTRLARQGRHKTNKDTPWRPTNETRSTDKENNDYNNSTAKSNRMKSCRHPRNRLLQRKQDKDEQQHLRRVAHKSAI